jgi:hypothetical protein
MGAGDPNSIPPSIKTSISVTAVMGCLGGFVAHYGNLYIIEVFGQMDTIKAMFFIV